MSDPENRHPLVWVVDDSPTERAITLRALGGGYRFEEFSDGADVVERLNSRTVMPDVILLDWVMPGMTGDEVTRYIRAHEAFAELAIILFTASRVETDDVVRGLSVGANDYVAKPFAPEELRARVQAVLRSKDLRESATRERTRLAAINLLGRALFRAGGDVAAILHELVSSLQGLVADGCAIILLPGELPPLSSAIHRADPSAAALTAIATLADPAVYSFRDSDDALAKLPPLYHPYIRSHGLRGLAILPFPVRNPVQGVVTLTRDGGSKPFDDDDLAAIETCIEYTSLAIQNAMRFETERTARSRLTAVLEHAPIGLVVTDPYGIIELANPAATRLVDGLASVRTIDGLLALGQWTPAPGDAPEGVRRGQLVLSPPGLAQRVLSVTTAGMVTALEDVTVQHAIGVERERVAAFQEQMLGIVGHDLRNPLSAIVTGSELLHEHTRDLPKVQNVVGRVQSSARRMTSIVNQLLDVTRARLGEGIPLALAELDLGALARSIVEELASVHRAARFEVHADAVKAVGDPDRLGQVLSNLIGNAAQYGDTSKPITVEVHRLDQSAVVEVTNAPKGAPIPASKLATLFDPYRRGEHSAVTHRSGLGLGLYIAHEIVRAHKGTLIAESTEAGTVFRVALPLRARD